MCTLLNRPGHFYLQNKLSCQSTLSVTVTVVLTRMPELGTSRGLWVPIPPITYSSLLESPILPPVTLTLCTQGLLTELSGVSRSRLKLSLRSLGISLLIPSQLPAYERSEECARRVGRYELPQTRRTKRGRSEGRQAETTPIDASAAVQIAGVT